MKLVRNALSTVALCVVVAAAVAFECPEAPVEYYVGLECALPGTQPPMFISWEKTDLTMEFGQTYVGSVADDTIVARNPDALHKEVDGFPIAPSEGAAGSTIEITGYAAVDCGTGDSPFSVSGLPVTLEALESTRLPVRFAPITPGEWQCILEPAWMVKSTSWDPGPGPIAGFEQNACTLSLHGSAVAGPEPACALQPLDGQFDFGQVTVGGWIDDTLTIRNETPDLLTTNQFKYVLENPVGDCGLFTIDPADTARVIGPGESRDIAVRFAPDAAGDFECTRSLTSLIVEPPTDPPAPIANACPTTVTWRGTGVIGAPAWGDCAPVGTNDWHGVFGLSASHIWVAGNGGAVIASGGDCNWTGVGAYFADVNLRDIWAYSDGASTVTWAVGNIPPPPGTYGETGAILRTDGALWNKVDEGIFVTYGAVWGSAFDDVYFVGTGVATDFPNAKHWNGTAFDTLHISPMGMSEVSGVSGNAANDIWAVLRQQTFSVYHYDGSEWTNETQPWMNKPLHDVWTVAGTGFYQVYAVGEDGAIYHFDGTHWSDESIPGETRDFYGVWVSQTGQVVVVGGGSVIYRSDGNNNWTQQTPSNVQGDLMDVWGASDSDVYAVGTNGLILRYAPPSP